MVRRGYCVWQNRNRLFLLQFNLLENAIGIVNLQLRGFARNAGNLSSRPVVRRAALCEIVCFFRKSKRQNRPWLL